MSRQGQRGSGGDTSLLESRHNHPGHLAHSPPEEHESDTDSCRESEHLNDARHANLGRDGVDDTLEVGAGYDGRSGSRRGLQAFSFLNRMVAGIGIEPISPGAEPDVLPLHYPAG